MGGILLNQERNITTQSEIPINTDLLFSLFALKMFTGKISWPEKLLCLRCVWKCWEYLFTKQKEATYTQPKGKPKEVHYYNFF